MRRGCVFSWRVCSKSGLGTLRCRSTWQRHQCRMGIDSRVGRSESMHAERPLQPDQRPLGGRQKGQAGHDRHGQPHERMKPERPLISQVDPHYRGEDQMAHDQNREIGRRIVGPVMEQIFATGRTAVGDLEIGAIKVTLPASRAPMQSSSRHGGRHRPSRPGVVVASCVHPSRVASGHDLSPLPEAAPRRAWPTRAMHSHATILI